MSKLSIKKKAKLNRTVISMLVKLERGDEVKWSNGPEDQVYVVLGLDGNIVFLVDEDGNEVEALNYEVTPI